MKKTAILILFVIFGILAYVSLKPAEKFKVIQIVEADRFYVDFNKNGQADENELIKVNGITAFRPFLSKNLEYQAKYLDTTLEKVLPLGVMAREFAFVTLFEKQVKVEFIDKGSGFATIYLGDEDYASLLLKQGLATVYKNAPNASKYEIFEDKSAINANIDEASKHTFVILNKKNNKYHKLGCEFGQKSAQYDVLLVDKLEKEAQKCKVCFEEIPVNILKKK